MVRRISLPARPRVGGIGLFGVAFGGLLLASLMLGTSVLDPIAVGSALLGQGSELNQLIVWELRLPRALAALAVGAALACAGALLQGITSNPIASPGLLGINAGAALALVTAGMLLEDPAPVVQQLFAFGGPRSQRHSPTCWPAVP